jgi:hypothetical protein
MCSFISSAWMSVDPSPRRLALAGRLAAVVPGLSLEDGLRHLGTVRARHGSLTGLAVAAIQAEVEGLVADEAMQEKECAICLLGLEGGVGGGAARELQCGHSFHPDCLALLESLATRPSCPTCREPLAEGPAWQRGGRRRGRS